MWFEMWMDDKKSMIKTMYRNMQADVDAGYNPFGECIKRQLKQIEEYMIDMNETLKKFRDMDEKKVEHWCKYDLIRRGVIEI